MIIHRTLTVDGGSPIPYVDIDGSRDGPRLTVIAGVHGGEYTSIATARRFAAELDPTSVSGRIVVAPVVNTASFWQRSAFVVPQDGKNLNRCFPGDPAGSTADRIAHAVFTGLIEGSDYILDLHAGDIPESLEPFTIYDESPVADSAKGLATAYGFAHCVCQPAAGRTVAGSSAAAAADVGIPAIIAECGGNGLLDATSVERHLAGLRNVARAIGVLPGVPEPAPAVRYYRGWDWLRAPTAGWWEPRVAVGSAVLEGSVLGVVSDVWSGASLAEIVAPSAGTVLFLTASPAVSAEGLLLGLALPAPEQT